MALNENYTIQKSIPLLSELRNSKLSLFELKLIEVYLSKIDSHKPQKRTVIFSKAELQNVFGKMLDVPNLRKSLATIRDLKVSEILINGTLNTERVINLFEMSELTYNENDVQEITLTCSESAMRYIFDIEELRYLRYKLRNVVQLTSKYSYHLFLYLIQNKFKTTWNVSVTELIDLLKSPYDDYTNFNKHILKPCVKEINSKTNLKCDYTTIRRGLDRATKEIIFVINSWGELEKVLGEIDEPQAIEITKTIEQETDQDERTSFFSECFDNTFNTLQVQLLMSSVNPACIIRTNYGTDIDKYNYLSRMYKRLRVEEQDKQISNRFKYFLSMIENDRGCEV